MAGHVVEISSSNYTISSSNSTGDDGDEYPTIVESNLVAVNGFINILDLVAIIPEGARPTNIGGYDLLNVWEISSVILV